MTDKNHIHKFKRDSYSTGSKFYFCVLDCNFKVAVKHALGKRTICWRCGEPFTMNQYALTLAKPHCEKCHVFKGDKPKPKKQREADTTPAEQLASVAASQVTSDLTKRLTSLSQGELPNNQPVKVIEYQSIDDEDLL